MTLEKWMSGQDPIPGPQLTCMQGLVSSTVLTAWTVSFTLGEGWEPSAWPPST